MTLPNEFKRDLLKPNIAGQAWLWLVEFSVTNSSDNEVTLRWSRNTEDTTYDSNPYSKMNMDVGSQEVVTDGSVPTVTLRVSSLNETLYDLVQETKGAIGADVKLIKVNSDYLATSISALEVDYENLTTSVDDEWIYFTLGVPNPMQQRFPLRDYSGSICVWANPLTFKGARCQYTGPDTSCTGTLEDCREKGNAENWFGFIGLNPWATSV